MDDDINVNNASSLDSKRIDRLLYGALTSDIKNRKLFLKGIDYSYDYGEVNRLYICIN